MQTNDTDRIDLYMVEGHRPGEATPVYSAGTDEHPYWTYDAHKARHMPKLQQAVQLKELLLHHIRSQRFNLSELRTAVTSDSLVIVHWRKYGDE